MKTDVYKRTPTERLLCFLIWGALTTALVLALLPMFRDSLAGIEQSMRIGSYEQEIMDSDDDSVALEWEKARVYNEKIALAQKKTPLMYQGSSATDDEYESILALGVDKVMCYLDVPDINLSIPVAHGTSSDILEYELGHMYGSSLPVGGENTHCVITGHTGYRTAKLFTDLVDLKEGDMFYINVLGERHRYQVVEINVVYPEEDFIHLQVEDGKDLVTLYTCTPYGVNTHRLLVKGERVLPDDNVEAITDTGFVTINRDKKALIRTIVIGSIPVLTALVGIWRTFRNPRRKKSKKETLYDLDEKRSFACCPSVCHKHAILCKGVRTGNRRQRTKSPERIR